MNVREREQYETVTNYNEKKKKRKINEKRHKGMKQKAGT